MERTIVRNRPLCDGTPRHEKGFRAYVTQRIRTLNKPPLSWVNIYCESPLFDTREGAASWEPAALQDFAH